MKRLFMVSYVYRRDVMRAMLNISENEDIKKILLRYHMESCQDSIEIKNVREYHESQQIVHVWYCD